MNPSTFSVKKQALKAILWGGGIGGAFDLIFALIYYGARGATFVGVLHSVAGGLIGRPAANAGGLATAALGFGLHFLIACCAATVFLAGSRVLPVLIKHAAPCGLLFGAGIYFFMHLVVLPLSAYHSAALPVKVDVPELIGHIVGVGLPIALAVRKFQFWNGPQATPIR